jgi:hypothetical protein
LITINEKSAMKKITYFLCFLALLLQQNLISQDTGQNKSSNVNWTVFWNGSINLEEDVFNKNKLTLNGFGAKMQKSYNSGIGIETKLSFRSWSDFDRTVIPFTIGPSYIISSDNKMKLLVRSGLGPELLIGNDYASIFAGFDIGPELHINLGRKQALVLGFAFAQAMSFHPDSFEYLDIYLGWRF